MKTLVAVLTLFSVLNGPAEAGRSERSSDDGRAAVSKRPICRCMNIKGISDYREVEALAAALIASKEPLNIEEILPDSMKSEDHCRSILYFVNTAGRFYREKNMQKENRLVTQEVYKDFHTAPDHGEDMLWALYPFLKREEVRHYYMNSQPFRFLNEVEYSQALNGMKYMMTKYIELFIDK